MTGVGATIGKTIDEAATAFAESLAPLMPQGMLAVEAGIVSQAIISIVDELYERFPNSRLDLIEALDGWEDTLRSRMEESQR